MKVVLDTNIYISAALKAGLSAEIVELAFTTNLISLITSEEILGELENKLLSKFERAENVVDIFIDRVRRIAEVVEIREKVDIVKRDPKDNKILECALSGKADIIVTADQDLIKIKTFRGIAIVHPKTLSWIFPKYFQKNKN